MKNTNIYIAIISFSMLSAGCSGEAFTKADTDFEDSGGASSTLTPQGTSGTSGTSGAPNVSGASGIGGVPGSSGSSGNPGNPIGGSSGEVHGSSGSSGGSVEPSGGMAGITPPMGGNAGAPPMGGTSGVVTSGSGGIPEGGSGGNSGSSGDAGAGTSGSAGNPGGMGGMAGAGGSVDVPGEADVCADTDVCDFSRILQPDGVHIYSYTYEEAQDICGSFERRLCTLNEVQDAYDGGWRYCVQSWIDGLVTVLPADGPGCGGDGVHPVARTADHLSNALCCPAF